MPLAALAFLLGALVAFYGNRLPDPFWFSLWPLLLVIACCQRSYRFLLLTLASYLFCGWSFSLALQDRLPTDLHDETLIIQGSIDSLVRQQPGRLSFLFSPIKRGQQARLPPLIKLDWYQDSLVPEAGSIWQLEVKLRPPRGRLNPRGFDYQKWLMVQGIGATGYVRESKSNQRVSSPDRFNLTHIRNQLLQQLRQACENCHRIGLIHGLAIGFRGDIEKQHQQALLETGTAHLLAISGLHIGLISMLFYYAGQVLWRQLLWRLKLRCETLASALALSGAITYAAMAGFSLPTQRALIFVIAIFAASLLRNRLNLTQCTAIAVMVTLLIDPLAIGSASFWLTLSALLVIGLTLFQSHSTRSRLRQLLYLQINFALFMSVPSLFLIGHFSLLSLPANLLAVPMVSLLILPLVFVAGVLLVFNIPTLPVLLLKLADYCLGLLMHYLSFLQQLGITVNDAAALPSWLILSIVVVIVAWWLPFPNPLRKLTLVSLLLLIQWRSAPLAAGDYRLSILDSGLGNAIVVETSTHSLLYDFGPGFPQGFSTLDQVIKPYLGGAGFSALDLLIISHVDQDHSGGFHAISHQSGLPLLLSGTPKLVKDRFQLQQSPRSCHEYPEWTWDGVHFSFLAGAESSRQNSNNQSCVLSVRGYHHALLPGDIEGSREQVLAHRYGRQLAADILVSPHHGSNSSSTVPFINLVSPGVVIHTQSEANRWGFPRPEVVARYDAINARQYRSGKHGAVVLTSTRKRLSTRISRQRGQRIWR